MKALLLAATLLFTASYASAAPLPSWYEDQGFTGTECGPAVGAMVVERMTGHVTTRHQSRAFDRRGINWFRVWDIQTIKRYLDSEGVQSSFVNKRLPKPGEFNVYFVNGNHFVIATYGGEGHVKVYDPMGGAYTRFNNTFAGNMSGKVMLKVGK